MPGPPLSSASAVVVGGGPAGLMAAEVLAEGGAQVTVFDRMPSVGRKFILAGRGGLNITHTEPIDAFLDRYGPARSTLAPAIEAFGPDALRAWCTGLGEDPVVGTSGRVFPASFRATSLLRAWLRRLDELGVARRNGHAWIGWADDGNDPVFRTATEPSIRVHADVVVLALGGGSWPRTGSDGEWVSALAADGVAVAPLRPANCGFMVDWTPTFRSRFAGTPLKNVALTHAGTTVRGDAMVTDTGLEGGPVYGLAPGLRDELGAGHAAALMIDLQPDVSLDQLTERLEVTRAGDSRSTVLRRAGRLAPVAIGVLREVTANRIPVDPAELARLVKAVPVPLTGVASIDRAISSAGGVKLGDVDDAFMLRHRPGTFVAGEMLDWEAPTGGYLLQGTFSTAVSAGHGALRWLRSRR